jgi:serine/threonine protein kinase
MIIPGVSEPIQSSQQSNFVKNFVPLGMIGHGSFSEVYKVRRVADGKIYALKKVLVV